MCRYTYKNVYPLIEDMRGKEDQNGVITVSRHAWLTLAILSVLFSSLFFRNYALATIPEIMKEFSIPYGIAAWIFSAYLIVAGVMTPIAGKMSDVYGKKRTALCTEYIRSRHSCRRFFKQYFIFACQ